MTLFSRFSEFFRGPKMDPPPVFEPPPRGLSAAELAEWRALREHFERTVAVLRYAQSLGLTITDVIDAFETGTVRGDVR